MQTARENCLKMIKSIQWLYYVSHIEETGKQDEYLYYTLGKAGALSLRNMYIRDTQSLCMEYKIL
jgi:hypothetical protein